MTSVRMAVMPDMAARPVMNLAEMRMTAAMTIITVMAIMAPPVTVQRDQARTALVTRVLVLDRLPVTNAPCRSGRRLAASRGHAEQDRAENQSRHNVHPPFHI